MTDKDGNLLWYGEYSAWGRLKKDERVYKNTHPPFRFQNQYADRETGLHYNLLRYYKLEAGRLVNLDPIGLLGGGNPYEFSPNINSWFDPLGLSPRNLPGIASGSGNLIGKKWLKGTHGNFHKEVLDTRPEIPFWKEDSIMLDRLYLIKLIDQLRNFEGSEEDEDVFLEKLENLVTDPNISDYIYWTNMSSEEIADKVLSYKPIILNDLSNS